MFPVNKCICNYVSVSDIICRLTAFVMKSFAQAQSLSLTIQNLITIDPNVVDQGVRYIIDNQNQEGSFMEKGFVFHKRMQVNI